MKLVKTQGVAVLTLNESEPVKHKTTGYKLHFVPGDYGGKITNLLPFVLSTSTITVQCSNF